MRINFTVLAGRRQLALVAVMLSGLIFCAGPAVQAARGDAAAAAGKPASGFEETWQVVYIGKSRVGYGRSAVERKVQDGREIVATTTEMSLAITRFKQPVKIKTITATEETPAGELLKFRFELLSPPAAPTRRTGKVENGKLTLDTEIAGKTTTSQLPWDESIKAPGYQDRMLREHRLKPGEKRTLKSFDPQFGKVNTIELQADDEQEVSLLDGTKRKLLKVNLTTSLTPGVTLTEFLNAEGEPLVTTMSLMEMATYQVTKEEALKSLSGEETDLAVSTLVKTNRIERPSQTQRVVYRVTIPGDDPRKLLPEGPTQKVDAAGPDSVNLTVTSIKPASQPPADVTPPGEMYVAANTHIQSDDELVRKLAKQAVGSVTDPWTAARMLERWVFQNLTKKNFSTLLASAAEVAKDLQGDCTEHAVLLAAMARAQGIPSRVAVGLVYISSAASFGGHMWTEMYINGAWIPLDATLGLGGIAADHIKFADSSFSDDGDSAPLATFLPLVSVLGKMKIEVREVQHK